MKFSVRAFVSARIIGRRELNCFRGRVPRESGALNARKLNRIKYSSISCTSPSQNLQFLLQNHFLELHRL